MDEMQSFVLLNMAVRTQICRLKNVQLLLETSFSFVFLRAQPQDSHSLLIIFCFNVINYVRFVNSFNFPRR